MDDILLKVFVFVDDFCKSFEPHWNKILLDLKKEGSRNRKPALYRLKEKGYEFIIGATLRKMEHTLKSAMTSDSFFSKENCKIYNENDAVREISHTVTYKNKDTKKEFKIDGNLIICHSKSRGKKDEFDRDKLLNKIKKVIGKSKSDAKKFITNASSG